jgi:hypothetical protein
MKMLRWTVSVESLRRERTQKGGESRAWISEASQARPVLCVPANARRWRNPALWCKVRSTLYNFLKDEPSLINRNRRKMALLGWLSIPKEVNSCTVVGRHGTSKGCNAQVSRRDDVTHSTSESDTQASRTPKHTKNRKSINFHKLMAHESEWRAPKYKATQIRKMTYLYLNNSRIMNSENWNIGFSIYF